VISDTENHLVAGSDVKEYQKRSYEDLSSEFQRLYPRAVELIPLMYNRLTLVDKLSHKKALAKIYNDHQHLSHAGFSKRNIRRNLPLDNATVPRRIRPSRPKNSQRLSATIPEQNQPASNNSDETSSLANNQKKKKKSHTYRNDNHNDLYAQNVELKQTVSRLTTFTKANDISKDEIEFRIPKEKGLNLVDAIQKCKNLVYLVFDKCGMLERAVPDIYRPK
jgi:hypothetical protein